ncbi:DNA repair protein RecN, partial [Chloroflexota bacterium]
IIEEIQWRLGSGLNVVTGETGAGKSLVVDAVESLLSGKVDEEAIRHGSDEALIEGVFALAQGGGSQLSSLLGESGLKADEENLVINCELRRHGRSMVRVNSRAVPRALLHQIGSFLVDVHGQSEHLSLLNRKYHLDFLDSYAHNLELRQGFGSKANELAGAEQEFGTLLEEEKSFARREEFLRFQIDEIERAGLREGEAGELERERNVLASCERLKELSFEAYQSLSGESVSQTAQDRLNEALQLMKKLVELDPALKTQLDFLEETLYGLEDAAREIRAYSEGLEYNPARLEEIESRLELIRSLKRKYGQTVAEVLAYLENAKGDLEGLSHSSERKKELEGLCSRLKEEMGREALALSQARSQAAGKLVVEVKKELRDLGMSQVDFEVSVTQVKDEGGIPFPDGGTYSYTPDGADTVEFLVSTNPGEPLKPLARIASTGEISRFMLALKSALSEADNIPVLIFDEIDIGVGGRSGEMLGKKLWLLAQNRQVICVTHLPQIAAFADAHFSAHKDVVGARTLSMLQALQGESRLEELAVMLAGPQYTETSLKNAGELMEKAEKWKQAYRARV